MLNIDPNSRISAEDALHHPFFTDLQTESPEMQISTDLKPYAQLMRNNEIELSPTPTYMESQKFITDSMRAVLVDWLIDVSIHFEVMSETLHFAISYID